MYFFELVFALFFIFQNSLVKSDKLYDLSYALNSKIPIFPSMDPFNYTKKVITTIANGNFLAYNHFVSAEHVGKLTYFNC